MAEFFARHRVAVIGFIGLVLPLFLLYVHGRHPRKTTIIESGLIRLTAPVQEAASRLFSGLADFWQGYVDVSDAASENLALKAELERAQLGLSRVAELESENERLRQALEFKRSRRDLLLVGAHVIGKDVSPYARVVRIAIDAGAVDGIAEGMPVIAPAGLVGRVARASGSFAEVLLTVDAQSTVNVKCRDKGVTGTVTGTGSPSSYVSRFSYLHRSAPLAVGDVLITSGHDKAFPPGIPVGIIRSIEERQRELEYELEVSPVVNFGDLEDVYVVVGVVDDAPVDPATPDGGAQ
jgi:rod shape-determining protein MreC